MAIVRVEMMYPFPQAQIEAMLKKYPSAAELYWVQEEPRNMGPWRFMLESMHSLSLNRLNEFCTMPAGPKARVRPRERRSGTNRSSPIWSAMLSRRLR